MPAVAYVFERFPSFGQTFCYREIAELSRQGLDLEIFSIRRPIDEPPQDWDPSIVDRVHYLPPEKELVPAMDALLRGSGGRAADAIKAWGRQSDFLRLYQAAYIGGRLDQSGTNRLHAHFAGMAARTAYWIHDFFDVPYSFTAHANDIFAPRPFVIGLEKLTSAAAAVVAVSEFGADFLRENHPQSAVKIHRIYNGIDIGRFQRATFDAAVPTIVSVGRLIEKKGFGDLISACALLKSQGVEFQCTIIGEGPLESALTAQICSENLQPYVHLLGPRPEHEVAAQLTRATVFALPCKVEADGGMDNLPTVIMEAMAAGLPVVSTRLAGVPEMVEEGVTGFLVESADVAALAGALHKTLLDMNLARTLGQAGHRAAHEKFSIATSARALRSLFAETMP